MAAIAIQLPDLQDDLKSLPLETSPAASRQECVLLIEDDEEAMWLVRYALQEHGNGLYRLKWSNTLNEGLEQLADGGIDVVLLDLGLPDSSGTESYAWVHEVSPKVPVVVLTGDKNQETEMAVTGGGAEGYLVKDQVSGSLLLQAIRAALHENKLRTLRPITYPSLLRTRFRLG
jgi:DNA-binding NarL/FixJ family response regulator